MRTTLVKLVETDVQDLTGHRFEASDFHALVSPGPVREILGWWNDPKAAQAKLTAQQWEGMHVGRFSVGNRLVSAAVTGQSCGQGEKAVVDYCLRFSRSRRRCGGDQPAAPGAGL